MNHTESQMKPASFDQTEPDPHLEAVLAWYNLSDSEWDSLSADAQHRLIDRFTDGLDEDTYNTYPVEVQAVVSQRWMDRQEQAWAEGGHQPGCEFDDKGV